MAARPSGLSLIAHSGSLGTAPHAPDLTQWEEPAPGLYGACNPGQIRSSANGSGRWPCPAGAAGGARPPDRRWLDHSAAKHPQSSSLPVALVAICRADVEVGAEPCVCVFACIDPPSRAAEIVRLSHGACAISPAMPWPVRADSRSVDAPAAAAPSIRSRVAAEARPRRPKTSAFAKSLAGRLLARDARSGEPQGPHDPRGASLPTQKPGWMSDTKLPSGSAR